VEIHQAFAPEVCHQGGRSEGPKADAGALATDGKTNCLAVTLTGMLAEPALRVRVSDVINIVADIAAGPDLNPRQEWILEQLKQGTEIQRVTVERQFGVGEKTAKRDLSELVEWGLIEYMRRGRKGSYRALVRRSWQNSDRIGPRGISSH